MQAAGYVEGQNLAVEWRYADGDYARLAGYAAELVQINPAAIVAYGTPAARAAQKATQTVPIVIAAAIDLVGSHFIASLARPGGNITGLSVIDVDLSGKQLELLKTLKPALSRVAVLLNPGNPAHAAVLKGVEGAASALGVTVLAVHANSPEAIGEAFAAAAHDGAQAVITAADGFFSQQGKTIAEAALNDRLPTIGVYREHVDAGTLMSYGPDIADYHRQAAAYVAKILKGARPADLPAEEPTKIELVINVRTAELVGLKVPPELFARADRTID
jgi:putative ABC transport system substrate-binding protein